MTADGHGGRVGNELSEHPSRRWLRADVPLAAPPSADCLRRRNVNVCHPGFNPTYAPPSARNARIRSKKGIRWADAPEEGGCCGI